MASFVYRDPENAPPGVKNEGTLPANTTKRAALGVITNQSRIHPPSKLIRHQPAKAAPSFTIYQDENAGPSKVSEHARACKAKENEPPKGLVGAIGLVSRAQAAEQPEHGLNIASESLPQRGERDEHRGCEEPRIESPMLLDQSVCKEAQSAVHTKEERMSIVVDLPEYAEEIYVHLREAERRFRPKPGYMRKQPDINESMRCILVDWLVEVAEEYKLQRETLFLAVGYVDRFLSHMSVQRGKLQLVGTASMYLASKFEEIYPPDVNEFVYITDDTYTRKQVLRMEHLILKVLSFDVAAPTACAFAERLLRLTKADDETYAMTMYLAELTLVNGETYSGYLPSIIATASTCLANHVLGHHPSWNPGLHQASQYSFSDIELCLQDLHRTLSEAATHPQKAVREKYKHTRFHGVGNCADPPPLVIQH